MTTVTSPTIAELRDRLVARRPSAPEPAIVGDASARVPSITHDSRSVGERGMYACLRGTHHDGHSFAAAAVAAGAASLLVDHPLAQHQVGADVNQLVVDDTRVALGPVAAAVHGDPSTALRLVGVTGTNGKTTTTSLLAAILRAAGDRHRCHRHAVGRAHHARGARAAGALAAIRRRRRAGRW